MLEEGGHGIDEGDVISAHQARKTGVDSLLPFGRVAHDQHGLAHRGGFFLYAADAVSISWARSMRRRNDR